MGFSCGVKCAKITLIIFNLVFFIGGLVVMGVGIWMLVDKTSFITMTSPMEVSDDFSKLEKADSAVQQIAYLLITSGVIVFVIAFFGCCGALKEWRPLLVTYSIFLVIVLGLEIAAGIYAGIYRGTSSEIIPKTMDITLRKLYQHDGLTASGNQVSFKPSNFWTNTWNKMMIQLQCCGISGGKDFSGELAKYKPQINDAPVACCKFSNTQTLMLLDQSCGFSRNGPQSGVNSNYDQGCLSRLNTWLDDSLKILIGVGIGIGLLQIFGVVFAICLCMSIQSSTSQVI